MKTQKDQYFVECPLFVNTCWIRRGIESIRDLQYSDEISCVQMVKIFCFRASKELEYLKCTFFLRMLQQFSIGFKSGLDPGHGSKTWNVWRPSQLRTNFAVWHGAPSCWKYLQEWTAMWLGSFSFIIDRYLCEFMVVPGGRNVMAARPLAEMAP